jgi:hypothetical protein
MARRDQDMSEGENVELRRYPSRKLYNKNASSYVRLPEVAEMVRKGANIRVEDTEVGSDFGNSLLEFGLAPSLPLGLCLCDERRERQECAAPTGEKVDAFTPGRTGDGRFAQKHGVDLGVLWRPDEESFVKEVGGLCVECDL